MTQPAALPRRSGIGVVAVCWVRSGLGAGGHRGEGFEVGLDDSPARGVAPRCDGCVGGGVVGLYVALDAWWNRSFWVGDNAMKEGSIGFICQRIAARLDYASGIEVAVWQRMEAV